MDGLETHQSSALVCWIAFLLYMLNDILGKQNGQTPILQFSSQQQISSVAETVGN